MDQESLLRQNIAMLKEELGIQERVNREDEIKLIIHDVIIGRQSLDDLSPKKIRDLELVVDKSLQDVRSRIEQLHSEAVPRPPQEDAPVIASDAQPVAQVPVVAPNSASGVGMDEPMDLDSEPRHAQEICKTPATSTVAAEACVPPRT